MDDADTEETGGEYITDDAGDAYQISAERAMDRWGVLAWPPRLEAENVHMTVKAHRVGGSATDGYGYGLFCRADGQENLYAFTIWANHATIEKRIHGSFKKLGTDDRATAAPEGDSEKELQAVCRTISGGAVELEFWWDNQLILDPTDVDDPYTGGNFGLFAALGQGQGSIGDTLVVRFDDFLAKGQRALRRGDLWARWTPSRGKPSRSCERPAAAPNPPLNEPKCPRGAMQGQNS